MLTNTNLSPSHCSLALMLESLLKPNTATRAVHHLGRLLLPTFNRTLLNVLCWTFHLIQSFLYARAIVLLHDVLCTVYRSVNNRATARLNDRHLPDCSEPNFE